ncbi:MAG: glycosyltransferase family 39 protein [Candidatus Wallbacteria bacterium]|nr:glycosyltransferase family 39 protein [Candidatus Wallbacteria bacterium]
MRADERPARLVGVLALLVAAWYLYTFNLTPGVLVGDDEGEFTYAAWRQSLGERVYRDVAFDAAPVPIYLGAMAYKWAGATHLTTKRLTIAFSLLAGMFTYLLGERLFGRPTGLLAAALTLSNAYWHFFSWFFTADAFYICFYVASVYFFACAWQNPERRGAWLMAGALGAISFFSKFFGLFAFGGAFLFAAHRLATDERHELDRRAILAGLGWMAAAGIAVGLFFIAPMSDYLDRFLALTVEHHSKAVPTLSPFFVFYAFFAVLWFEPTPLAHRLLLFMGVLGLTGRGRQALPLRALLVWHSVQALVFLVVKMELYARHLLYLVPFLSILAADQLATMASERGEARRASVWLGSWILLTALVGFSSELPTYKHQKLVELVQRLVPPGGTVLAEHGEIAFLAQRRNVPLRDVPASGTNPAAPRIDAREIVEAIRMEQPEVALVMKRTRDRSEDNHFLGQIKDEHLLMEHLQSTYATYRTTDPELGDYHIFTRRDLE